MTHPVVDWLLRLTGRERALLLVMALCLVAGVGAGLLLPLADRRAAAEARVAEARALDVWIAARTSEAGRLRAAAGPGPVPPIGLAALQRSLEQARLIDRVATLSARTGGGIEMRFEAVDFDSLIAWVTQVEPAWGYAFAALRIERGTEPGLVTAQIEIVPQQ